jgi:hypothetical protein
VWTVNIDELVRREHGPRQPYPPCVAIITQDRDYAAMPGIDVIAT